MTLKQSTSELFDTVVIGAGVVGCAVARRLTLDGARVIVLEKAKDVLDGASKANSAILHTGFDAPTGSLEHACVTKGYQEYLEIREELDLPILKSGAMVLAWSAEQLDQLESLIQKAHSNGVTDASLLSKKEILNREVHLSPSVAGGFEIPGEFLIDPWTTAHAYILQAMANGAELLRETEVVSGEFDGSEWTLNTTNGYVRSKQVISCAGLYGDLLDERLIGKKTFTITPRKGQFVVFDKSAAALASSIILPVPTKKTKGVVICRTIFGNLLVGPTAENQESRTDASTDRETLLGLRAQGVKLIPGLENCEVTATYAGLRPASEFQDYQISHEIESNYISVGGIRSTGLSAALGIARYVVELGASSEHSKSPITNPLRLELNHLSNYHPRDWEEKDNGGIVCHCEQVTRREIEKVLAGPMPPKSLQGLKRRTRVGMGQCQGFNCTGPLSAMTEGAFNLFSGQSNDKK